MHGKFKHSNHNYENTAASYKCFQELCTELRYFVAVVDTLLFLGTSCKTSAFFVYQNHSYFAVQTVTPQFSAKV